MLFDIVIIVLRETLEASVLIAILLSLSKKLEFRFGWLAMALVLGAFGSVLYGNYLDTISDWFDYSGQEVVNSTLQFLIYFLLVVVVILQSPKSLLERHILRSCMILTVLLAFIREGSELYVFYSGFLQGNGNVVNAATSGFIGLAIGLSVGAIIYYFCIAQSLLKINVIHTLFLMLIAGGLVLQATRLLTQIDWISGEHPIWDTNHLIPESSVTGQLVYALFGYEATPSATEIAFYCTSISIMVAALVIRRQLSRNSENRLETH